jgi:hypothetical protein
MGDMQKSRRDNTLLTVDGAKRNLRKKAPLWKVPQGRHFLLRRIQVSSLRVGSAKDLSKIYGKNNYLCGGN